MTDDKYMSDDQRAARALIGRRILRLWVSPGEDQLTFETDEGDVVWDTYADCCSETWFADILGVDSLLGGTVMQAETVDLPAVKDGRTRQEEDSFYGVKLTTNKGVCDIIYRNSSNGYYGGNAHLGESRKADAREITADWQA